MAYLLQLGSPDFFADPYVILGFAVAFSISALAYMAGEFFSMPSLKAFSKLELREIFVTAVIILLLAGLALPGGVYDKVAHGMAAPDSNGNPPKEACEEWIKRYGSYDTATQSFRNESAGKYGNYAFGHGSYFLGCRMGFSALANFFSMGLVGTSEGVLMQELLGFYREFMIYEMVTGIASTFTISIEFPQLLLQTFLADFHLSNILPFIFLSPVNEAQTLLADIVGTLLMATAAQHMLLDFIQVNVPKVILPLGVAMRAFPFSRKAGSTIIAFAFVAYFIYPLTILVNERIYATAAHKVCAPSLNLAEDGDYCGSDAQCCSKNCIGNECRPQLGDFTKFASTYAVCGDNLEDVDADAIQRKLELDAQQEIDYRQQAAIDPPSVTPKTKAATVMKEYQPYIDRQKALNEERMGNGEFEDSVFITPSAASSLVRMFEVMVSEAGRLMALHAIFIVMEILLTLTLLKDISILIGGEPRILGISKLV